MTDMPATDEEWKKKLTPEQYHVLREKGEEYPGTGKYLDFYEDGSYHCAGCGNEIFESEAKYESTTPGLVGWPAFTDSAKGAVKLQEDNNMFMNRTEVICSNCGSHLGHFFPDASSPNGQHYCINSAAIEFLKQDK